MLHRRSVRFCAFVVRTPIFCFKSSTSQTAVADRCLQSSFYLSSSFPSPPCNQVLKAPKGGFSLNRALSDQVLTLCLKANSWNRTKTRVSQSNLELQWYVQFGLVLEKCFKRFTTLLLKKHDIPSKCVIYG